MADYQALKQRTQRTGPANSTTKDTSIDSLIKSYVEGRRLEAQSGQITVDTYKEARFKLEEFAKYCRAEGIKDIKEVSEAVLEDYRQCQLALLDPELAGEGEVIGKVTCKKRLARLKQWLQHEWEMKHLPELPRNIHRFNRISMHGERTRVARLGFWTLEEIHQLFQASSQRTKLYIALALNAGFTQKDIATLEHHHIDWKAGYIQRERNKTGTKQVSRLWPVTKALLEQEATDPKKSTFVLLGRNGNRLITEKIRENGLPSTTDVIKLAFSRVKVKVGLGEDKRGFATFRKTSANLLAKQNEGKPHIVDLFLAHTSKATRRFYVADHYEEYDSEVKHLGEHLNLAAHL